MTTVNGPSGFPLEPIRARRAAAEHRRFNQPPAVSLRAVWASSDDVPDLVEEVQALRYAVADAERRGWDRAVAALRDHDAVRAHFGWVPAANLANYPDAFASYLEASEQTHD